MYEKRKFRNFHQKYEKFLKIYQNVRELGEGKFQKKSKMSEKFKIVGKIH